MTLAEQERAELAALARTLTPAQWEVPSLCAGWRVRDVVAHVISYEGRSIPQVIGLFGRAARERVRPAELAKRELLALPDDELVAAVQRWRTPTGITAGMGGMIALTDGMIHAQDIRRPLGLPREIPAERIRPVLDAARRVPAIPGWRIGRGLSWVATDLDWSSGRGPEVRGPAESLLMALAGRRGAIKECEGPGVRLARARTRQSVSGPVP